MIDVSGIVCGAFFSAAAASPHSLLRRRPSLFLQIESRSLVVRCCVSAFFRPGICCRSAAEYRADGRRVLSSAVRAANGMQTVLFVNILTVI